MKTSSEDPLETLSLQRWTVGKTLWAGWTYVSIIHKDFTVLVKAVKKKKKPTKHQNLPDVQRSYPKLVNLQMLH